mgnify:CR=1 FL=1
MDHTVISALAPTFQSQHSVFAIIITAGKGNRKYRAVKFRTETLSINTVGQLKRLSIPTLFSNPVDWAARFDVKC